MYYYIILFFLIQQQVWDHLCGWKGAREAGRHGAGQHVNLSPDAVSPEYIHVLYCIFRVRHLNIWRISSSPVYLLPVGKPTNCRTVCVQYCKCIPLRGGRSANKFR